MLCRHSPERCTGMGTASARSRARHRPIVGQTVTHAPSRVPPYAKAPPPVSMPEARDVSGAPCTFRSQPMPSSQLQARTTRFQASALSPAPLAANVAATAHICHCCVFFLSGFAEYGSGTRSQCRRDCSCPRWRRPPRPKQHKPPRRRPLPGRSLRRRCAMPPLPAPPSARASSS